MGKFTQILFSHFSVIFFGCFVTSFNTVLVIGVLFIDSLLVISLIGFNIYIYIYIYQVLRSLREKHDESLLRELKRKWKNNREMVIVLSRFFHFLNRYFIAGRSLPALNEVGLTCFRDLVCYKSL